VLPLTHPIGDASRSTDGERRPGGAASSVLRVVRCYFLTSPRQAPVS
jgi:hypothetical protein